MMVAKDICFHWFLHPTSGYKAWLTADIRSVRMEEKDYQKSKKRKKDQLTTLIYPKFYFSALYDSHVFSFEFNKGLECSKSPMETIYYLLI